MIEDAHIVNSLHFTQNNFDAVIVPDIKDNKIAVISNDFSFDLTRVDIAVFKPYNYCNESEFSEFLSRTEGKERYLYVPPFASGRDIEIIRKRLKGFEGVYAEGYFGERLAKDENVKLFAGTGFNVFNRHDAEKVSGVSRYFAYSKELSAAEINAIGGSGFTLALGGIQVMDLIYCPFSENCAHCGAENVFTLADEMGRKFQVRRYKLSSCRFEIYNPYPLVSDKFSFGRRIFDFTLLNQSQCNGLLSADNINKVKNILTDYTSGNLSGGIK